MKNAIVKLFDPTKAPPLLFLVVGCIFGITIGTLQQVLQSYFQLWQILLFGIVILITIFLSIEPIIFYSGTLLSNMGKPPKKHKGLIVLCSLGNNISAEQVIRYHYPILKTCWMITGGHVSEKTANDLIVKLIQEGYSIDIFKRGLEVSLSPEDADNPLKTYEVIENIFNNLPEGFDESDIIADYTGGTKSMTAGMILACALPKRNLQVLKPNKYKEDGTADREAGGTPRTIDINFKLKLLSGKK